MGRVSCHAPEAAGRLQRWALCGILLATGHVAAILPAYAPRFGYNAAQLPSQQPSLALWYAVENDGAEPPRLSRVMPYGTKAVIRPDRL
jgi:hypothetical protein